MLVYADNAATTKISKSALDAMMPIFETYYGNPSSLHTVGQEAAEKLLEARESVAKNLGAEAREIYFTSGGSEADNQAINTAAILGARKGKKHIISTAFEHHAVLHTLKKLEKEPGLCASNPYIYVYTKGYVRKYRIFSFYETTEGSATYDDFEGTDGYDQYVKRCLSKSTLAIDEHTIDFAKRPALLTLSTCIGRSGGNQRFVVHAALEGAYNITGECRP